MDWMELDSRCVLFDTKDIVLAFYENIGWDDLGLYALGNIKPKVGFDWIEWNWIHVVLYLIQKRWT